MGPWDPNRWLRNQGRGDEGADGPHFRQTTPTTTTRTSRSRCPPSRPPGAPLRGRALARLHGPRPAEWTSRPAFQSRATTLAARAPPSPTTRTTTQVRVRPPGLALLRSRHLRSSRLFCMPAAARTKGTYKLVFMACCVPGWNLGASAALNSKR